MGFMLQGAHRGGSRFVERVPESAFSRYGHHLVVADPQPGRAEFLVIRAQERFPGLRATGVRATGREALAFTAPGDPLVLASDSLGSLRQTLAARSPSQPAFWQIIGRGPGGEAGMRLGLQGTLLPNDPRATADSELLLQTLERLAPPASSLVLTRTDPLAATVLAPLRERVLSRTLRHLGETEREPADLSGGSLGVATANSVLPLQPVAAPLGMRYAHYKELALETLDTVPPSGLLDRGILGQYLMVAVVDPATPAIHLLTVIRTPQDRRRVDGLFTLARPLEVAVASAPAAFTD